MEQYENYLERSSVSTANDTLAKYKSSRLPRTAQTKKRLRRVSAIHALMISVEASRLQETLMHLSVTAAIAHTAVHCPDRLGSAGIMNHLRAKFSLGLLALVVLTGLASESQAANQPCSGKKGGIERCDGSLFICNDGSISGSKRNCRAEIHDGSEASLRSTGNISSECACGSGTLYTGPRGGQYCITSSGEKSYKRN